MANVDMIPRSYRESRRTRRLLARYGAALALLVLVGLCGSGLLRWRLSVALPNVEILRGSSARVEAARTLVVAAQARKTALEEDLAALAALRGVGAIAAMTDALDASLNDKVWLDKLVFSRTQEKLSEPTPAPLPGTVVRARALPPSTDSQAWRLVDNVEMRGSALDHAGLNAFLNQASLQPAMRKVRFLESSVATVDEGQLVEFSSAGPLGPAGGQP